MRRAFHYFCPLALIVLCWVPSVQAGGPLPDFQPDPRTVQRHGPAYRYPQAGWIVLHIEGEPYERGFQHGKLLAPEIAAHIRCFAAMQCPGAPSDGWRLTRSLVNALFVRRYDKEYLEEMKGIADGATAAGARFDDRPLDLVDIVALNSWPEVDTLDSALDASPTGLEALRPSQPAPKLQPLPKPEHCSAFAATGPATADGKIVFGHITMFSLYPANFYNVWLDVKPSKGHRVLMQTYPGGIQSGMDYFLNDAGLLVSETTIRQTTFDPHGQTEASRIRKALQYADSIDGVVAILRESNNGLYTNEWLLADTKTNEIAMFELGTHKSRLYRSGKDDWFGGTPGFYWGCNNTKDLQVRLETIPGSEGRPANMVFHPSDRDRVWQRLYRDHRGKIDVDFARAAFTTPPIAAYHSLDAKFTTTGLAGELKTWALFGPPLGRTWEPTFEDYKRYAEVRPLVSNPWTVLHAAAPARTDENATVAVDLEQRVHNWKELTSKPEKPLATVPAWHGTILPRGDADLWLAAAFAEYERHVALENALKARAEDGKLTRTDRERLALNLFGYRTSYLSATLSGSEEALANTVPLLEHDEWYRIALGKGVLLLHDLRQTMGPAAFAEMMDSFGRSHAGKEVTVDEFRAHAEKAAGRSLDDFFKPWLGKRRLPSLRLEEVSLAPQGAGYLIRGEIHTEARRPATSVELLVRTGKGEVTKFVRLDGPTTSFTVETKDHPRRLIVDPYGESVSASGVVYSTLSFTADLEHTRIVYGTATEESANREAAEALQRAIIQRGSNVTVPIRSDKEMTAAELQNHLLLIGRPETNTLVARLREALPVAFGPQSFVVGEEVYANPDSAVIVAGQNQPGGSKFSVVVIAGLDSAATLRAAPLLMRRAPAEVIVLSATGEGRDLVLPARDLVREWPQK